MAEWRYRDLALYRDDVCVGLVDDIEVAAEIAETMNRVGALLDEVRREPVGDCADGCTQHATCQPARERSRQHYASGAFQRWHNRAATGGVIRDSLYAPEGPEGCGCTVAHVVGTPHERPADAERRSEATPQNDLCRGCGRTSHGFACPAQLEAARREQDLLSRVDPYDTTKGGIA